MTFSSSCRVRQGFFSRALICSLLAGLFPLRVRAEAPGPIIAGQGDQEERPRVKITGWKFINIFKESAIDMRDPEARPGPADEEGHHAPGEGDIEDGKKVIAEQMQKFNADPDLKHVGDLFAKHPFEVVEAIAKAKALDADTTMKLAEARRAMINEAMSSALQKIDLGKQLSIGMLDSGNKNSGIASDVDQTLFLTPRDTLEKVLKEKGLSESKMIDEVIKAFNSEFEAKYGCTPERLGVECMNGADFFPDWRAEHNSVSYEVEVDRVVSEKRRNPEAYRSEGQLKSQAEGRGYRALREHSERIAELDSLKSVLDEVKAGNWPDSEKPPPTEEELVKKYLLEFDGLKPKANTIAAIEEELKRVAPWTEVNWDHGSDPPRPIVEHLVDTRNKVLKLEPEFVKRFAFDGAWDNWLMFEAHPQNRKKYLLRSVAEGISLLRKMPEGAKLSTFEYEKEFLKNYHNNSMGELDKFLNDVYRPQGQGESAQLRPERLERIRKVMAVAAMDRLRHKGEKPFGTYDDMRIYAEYMPEISDADRRMYENDPKALEGLKQMRLEAAKRAWELESRAMMIENLLRTVQAPVELMNGGLSDKEFTEMKKKYPHASRKKMDAAIEKSLFHGLHDLMTVEYAKTFLEKGKNKSKVTSEKFYSDPAFRLMEEIRKMGNPEIANRIEEIARDAAFARLCTEPDAKLRAGRKDRFRNNAFFEYVHETYKTRLESGKRAYAEMKKNYESGKYTREYVADRLMKMSADRAISSIHEVGEALGFNIHNISQYWPVMGQKKLPMFFIEFDGKKAFSSRKLFSNLVTSAGNYDSALQVMLEYQLHGAEAAGWAAVREMAMNFPGIAQGAAVYDLFAHGRPQGIVMMGSAMFIPGMGQALIVVSITTTSVTLVGNYLLLPLGDDLADLAYQGFLSQQEAGWFRAGVKKDFESNRVSMLHFVKIRAIPEFYKTKDGKEGMNVHVALYSKEEAFDLDFIETTVGDDYEYLMKEGKLGGGPEWDALLKRTATDYKLRFEAQRLSLFYHYEKAALAYLKKHAPGVEVFHTEDSSSHLVKMFRQTVDNWCDATGEFSEFDENLTRTHRFTNEIRMKLAIRMTQDFFRSMEILRESEQSREKSFRLQCQKALEQRTAAEANTMMLASTDARRMSSDFDMLSTTRQAIVRRKDKAREPAPRYHVRPKVVSEKIAPHEYKEKVEFLVSIIANPEEFPPPYKIREFPEIVSEMVSELGMKTDVLYMKVVAYDSTGKEVLKKGQKPWRKKIGAVSKKLLPSQPKLKLAHNRSYFKGLNGVEIEAPKIESARQFQILRATKPEGPWFTIAKDADTDRKFLDSFPAAFRGAHTWHYATVPKTREQIGREVEAPDTSHRSSISLNLEVPAPDLKTEVMSRTAYNQSKETPQEREKRLAEERKAEQNWTEEKNRARQRMKPEDYQKWVAEKEEVRRKLREAAQFSDPRFIVLSWKTPKLSGPLKDSNQVFLQLFQSDKPEGPFWLARNSGRNPYERHPVKGNVYTRIAEVLPGRSVFFKARIKVRTGGGTVFSDWSEAAAEFPEERGVFGSSTRGRGMNVTVGKDQTYKFKCLKASFKLYSQYSDFQEYFEPHGPEGMNESSFQRFSQDQERKTIEDFWKRHRRDLERKRKTRAELQQQLDKELKRKRKYWYAERKKNAPLSGANLYAVIGKFVPRPILPPGGQRQAAEEKPVPTYFLIGKEADFTAPEPGNVSAMLNWPSKPWGSLEQADEIYVTARCTQTSTQGRAAPAIGSPEWTRRKNGKFLEEYWQVTFKPGWRPVPGETFEFLSAPSMDGPWFRHLGEHNEPFAKAPVSFHRRVAIGQRAFLRTRTRYARGNYLYGDSWSAPIEVFKEPEPVIMRGQPAPGGIIFARKGQTVHVKVTGTWDPVRFKNLEPYGPDGISESLFQEKAREMLELENSLTEKQKKSNQPNLLGLNLPAVSTAEPGLSPKGGLRNVGYFLMRKGSFPSANHPAGCLLASYRSTSSRYHKYGTNQPFSDEQEGQGLNATMKVTRDWSFTFPRDGFIFFLKNSSANWTGSHYFEGGGQLTLTITYSGEPDSGEDAWSTDWTGGVPVSANAPSGTAQTSSSPPASKIQARRTGSSSGGTPAPAAGTQARNRPRAPASSATTPNRTAPDTTARSAPGAAPAAAPLSFPTRQGGTQASTGQRTRTTAPPTRPAPSRNPAASRPGTAASRPTRRPATGNRTRPAPAGQAGSGPGGAAPTPARSGNQASVRVPQTARILGTQKTVKEGARLFQQGKLKAALAQYERATRAAPFDASAWSGLGMTQNALGDHQKAIASYQQALRVNPQLPNVSSWIAENYLALGNRQAARSYFLMELNRNPKSGWAMSFLGTIASMDGQNELSKQYFQQAARLDPNVATHRFNNGRSLAGQRKLNRALWEFTSALTINPNFAQAYYWLGSTYTALGNRDRAILNYQYYLRFDQTSQWATKARQEIERLKKAR